MSEWIAISVIGRDRPGIVASVSRVLYRNHCNIEELSQMAVRGQFAMILIASASSREGLRGLEGDFTALAGNMALDINLRKIREEELGPYEAGESEPFVITARGEDRPGLVCGITEILAEAGYKLRRGILMALRAGLFEAVGGSQRSHLPACFPVKAMRIAGQKTAPESVSYPGRIGDLLRRDDRYVVCILSCRNIGSIFTASHYHKLAGL